MLLILTNSLDATTSQLVPALNKSKVPFLRLDTDTLLSRSAISYSPCNPAMRIDGNWYKPADIRSIWYRRPEKLKDGRFDSSPESRYALSEWTEFTECFFAHVPKPKWMNHPSHNAMASRKLEQLTTALALGFSVPDTLATQEPEQLRRFFNHHQGQVIVKPLSTGCVERPDEELDSLIYTNRVTASHLDDLSDLPLCPTLFQQFIQKQYDVRITVVDSDIHAVILRATDEIGGQRCDIRRNNMADVAYEVITLPDYIELKIKALMSHYGLRFAAIDMAVSTDNKWCFFEINPNGQWAWLDTVAGTNISASFVKSFSENI